MTPADLYRNFDERVRHGQEEHDEGDDHHD